MNIFNLLALLSRKNIVLIAQIGIVCCKENEVCGVESLNERITSINIFGDQDELPISNSITLLSLGILKNPKQKTKIIGEDKFKRSRSSDFHPQKDIMSLLKTRRRKDQNHDLDVKDLRLKGGRVKDLFGIDKPVKNLERRDGDEDSQDSYDDEFICGKPKVITTQLNAKRYEPTKIIVIDERSHSSSDKDGHLKRKKCTKRRLCSKMFGAPCEPTICSVPYQRCYISYPVFKIEMLARIEQAMRDLKMLQFTNINGVSSIFEKILVDENARAINWLDSKNAQIGVRLIGACASINSENLRSLNNYVTQTSSDVLNGITGSMNTAGVSIKSTVATLGALTNALIVTSLGDLTTNAGTLGQLKSITTTTGNTMAAIMTPAYSAISNVAANASSDAVKAMDAFSKLVIDSTDQELLRVLNDGAINLTNTIQTALDGVGTRISESINIVIGNYKRAIKELLEKSWLIETICP